MTLWGSMTADGPPPGKLLARGVEVALADCARRSLLGPRLEEFRGRSVVLAPRDQLIGALALIELDGVARRIVLCPPDLAPEHAPAVAEIAQADGWLRDPDGLASERDIGPVATVASAIPGQAIGERRGSHRTEWILLTSGTTGMPKLVLHTLDSLTSAMARRSRAPAPRIDGVVWSTFYDIRRYGGLQIFLRAMLGRASLVLSSPGEPVVEFLSRAGAAAVTHISGTPSHWRRALMSGASSRIAPRYVRLSGEIADQAIIDNLRSAYPQASVAHAFASTEAGVAFEVGDGLAGFPQSLVGTRESGAEVRILDGTLQIRSPGNAERYLGDRAPPLKRDDGFVDTGDQVELRDGRYYFVGRRGGVVNVGGLKVHPEEVEAVINTHPWVRMSLVKARRSPITGAVVSAEIVLRDATDEGAQRDRPPEEPLRREILDLCRRALAPHKVPAMIRFVSALEVSASGKLARSGA
jgi:acyl-coenzyme A synthetase/AMP-(fatty) acid ligase